MYINLTKTCLHNFDPLKPHFYIVKLGFTGVYIIFLISARKHRLWVLKSTHNLCFEQKCEKYQSFLSEHFQFLDVNFSIYLNRRVFVMSTTKVLTRLCVFAGYLSVLIYQKHAFSLEAV